MKILDLFCGAGGAAMGIHRALPDADIIGVDIKPQKHYPFTFVQSDAMTFPLEGYDFIWASPPCQKFSVLTQIGRRGVRDRERPDLLTPTHHLLEDKGTPFVIENVASAPVRTVVQLCGCMFGLGVFRARKFETSRLVLQPCHNPHAVTRALPYFSCPAGMGGAWRGMLGSRKTEDWRKAMGIDWMSRYELTQAVPPAYSEFIMRQIFPEQCAR